MWTTEYPNLRHFGAITLLESSKTLTVPSDSFALHSHNVGFRFTAVFDI